MKVLKRKTIGVKNSGLQYQIAADHEYKDMALTLADTLLDNIAEGIVNHPRSQQKRIGPSEMGIECKRALLHKLNEDDEPARAQIPWKPTLGTATHAWLEDTYNTINTTEAHPQYGRWIPEMKVWTGNIGPIEVRGSVDLFDTWTGSVIDWKVVGKSTLQQYRAHGPSAQYRGQGHIYGQGYANAGQDVRLVMIVFLPREGELTDTFVWCEPWRPEVAQEIFAQCNALYDLLQAVGIERAVAMFPACTDRWCKWCGSGSSFGRREVPTSTAGLLGLGGGNAAGVTDIPTSTLFK